jgi:glycosyltransferase involved in cell wall biosynthesis
MTRRLRVVRLLPTLDFGGVESRAQLQSELHDRDAFDLRVCTFHRAGAAAASIRAAGVPVDVLGQDPSVRNPRATLALWRYLRAHRPDAVHASIVEANFHALIVPPLPDSPKLIVEEVGSPSHGKLARLAFRLLYRRADAIIGVSQATCDYLLTTDGAPASKVRLVYNCAAPRYFSPLSSPRVSAVERRRQGKPFRLLLVGRLVHVKNQETILRAMRRVCDVHPNVELHLAGEGPLRGELEQLAARLGLRENVHFLGFQGDIRELLLDADLFLLPSHSEGCSISLVEAMSTGVPALGSDVPGIREVLGQLAPHWTLPPTDVDAWADRLIELVGAAPPTLDLVGEAARDIAHRKFSPAAYLSNVQQLYRTVTS